MRLFGISLVLITLYVGPSLVKEYQLLTGVNDVLTMVINK